MEPIRFTQKGGGDYCCSAPGDQSGMCYHEDYVASLRAQLAAAQEQLVECQRTLSGTRRNRDSILKEMDIQLQRATARADKLKQAAIAVMDDADEDLEVDRGICRVGADKLLALRAALADAGKVV